jgi:peptidoglycan/xylan/chitin deacetylase (PgdA/CDA1 family)
MKQSILKIMKSIFGSAEYLLRPWNYSSDELLVLCMHSTPHERREQFNELIDFLFKHFSPINPNQLGDYFSGKLNEGPYVLFTFDDGMKNNLMAAELLESRNARAVFFVVPDFVEAENPEAYYRTNIRQIIDPNVDHEPEDVIPMSLADLSQLLSRGHFIESHTKTHLLRSNSSLEHVEQEIAGSKRWLSQKLSAVPTVFCSPIQTNFSVNESAKRTIENEYDFHFTTFPGMHSRERNPHLVYRRNIEVHWSIGQIKYALGKADLLRWKGEIERFRQL